VDAPDRRRPILAAFEPLEQFAQVLQQPFLVRLCGDPIHVHRAVLARAPVRFFQPHQVDMVRQRQQYHLRCRSRQFRDLLLFQ